MNYFCPGSVNTHWGPLPVNTNLVAGPVVDKLMFWFSNCFLNFVRDLTPYQSLVVHFTSVFRILFFIVFTLCIPVTCGSFHQRLSYTLFYRIYLANRCKDQFINCRIWIMNFRTTFPPWSLDSSEYLFYCCYVLTFPLSPVYLFHDGIPYHLETSPLILPFKSMD